MYSEYIFFKFSNVFLLNLILVFSEFLSIKKLFNVKSISIWKSLWILYFSPIFNFFLQEISM